MPLPQLCSPHPASEEGSESEGSESSGRSCRNERSIQEKLQVLVAEGLLPAVKVFLDWLRTNPDLIVVCAQVRASCIRAGTLCVPDWAMTSPLSALWYQKRDFFLVLSPPAFCFYFRGGGTFASIQGIIRLVSPCLILASCSGSCDSG